MTEKKEHYFIKDLQRGEKIRSVYLLREKNCGLTKKGDYYISLEMIDRTGKVDAKVWKADEELFKKLLADRFLEIEGQVEVFKGFPQINISSIRPLSEEDEKLVKMENYLPASLQDIDAMYSELFTIIDDVKNPFCLKILKNIFSDPDFKEKFKMCPGATDFHHPYLGGLLEHTLSMTKLARIAVKHYPGAVNTDLLITGCLLHDIGKVDELTYRRSFNYSDRGKFIGHIIIGIGIVEAKIREITDFPEDLNNLILHLILSHHGEYEWGSPKRPKCLEAVMLHYLDNLDAKVNGFQCFVQSYSPDQNSSWTKYSKMFNEFLYKDSKLLDS